MRNMRRNKQDNFIRGVLSEEDDYGKKLYGDPFPFYENLSPVNGSSEIIEFGDRTKKMYKSTVQRNIWEDSIREGDAAYLEGASPFNEETPGEHANYTVVSVQYLLSTMTIYFEKKP